MTPTLVIANLAATLYMTGVIWFVQVVHYPLFGGVGTDGFPAYSALHNRLTTYVVMPPMLLELATAVALCFWRPAVMNATTAWTGLLLVGVIWASTFLLQVPRHEVLGQGFRPDAHTALVVTNWIRTIAWSARSLLMLWIVWRLVGGKAA